MWGKVYGGVSRGDDNGYAAYVVAKLKKFKKK
jgi:hypothetical protein